MKKFILVMLACLLSMTASLLAQNTDRIWLTGDTENVSMNPVFSPNGNYIAFTKAGYHGIYIYDISTASIFQITDEPSSGFAFKWSSDSKYILTRVARYSGMRRFNSVKVFDVQSGAGVQLTEESTNMPYLPEWLPGNNKVLLPTKDGAELIDTGIEPFFRENESMLTAYSKYNRIIVQDLLNSTERILEPVKGKEYLNVTISPDRLKIAFEVYGGNMFVVNFDGSGLTDLGIGYNPKWTYDSNQIVYMITEDDGHTFTSSDIYIINIDGTNKRNITNTDDVIELNPSISPDGNKIVFESYIDGTIYLMNLD